MLAGILSKALARRGVHYGWIMLATMFFSSLVMAGAVGLPGAFIVPLSKEFGWDVSEISAALAVRFLLFGLMGPFCAALIERYGLRRMVFTAQALVFVGLGGALFMTSLWQLFAFWGLMIGIGTGFTALVLNAIISTRWFTERRGLAIGILAAATSSGPLVFLPLATWLVDHYGWRFALLPSMGAIALGSLAVFAFAVERPADIGLAPYGEKGAPQTAPAPVPAGNAVARAFGVLGEASASPAFWILAGSFFVCGLSTFGLVQTHFIPLCVDNGMAAVAAAGVLAMMGAFDIVGTIGSGYLSDRIDSRKLLFWYYGLRGLSLLWLPFSTFSVYGLSIFAVFYGLDWIATVPPTVKLTGRAFGPEKAGLVFGWIFASHQVGSAIAAYGGGASRAWLHSYVPAFYVAGAACLVAAVMVLMIGRSGAAKPAVAAA
ncbi:MAG: MFS transporter [Hyphomicrobiales bacterium]|nr:MFS transporter [Hyphomicrobiales bacterium]